MNWIKKIMMTWRRLSDFDICCLRSRESEIDQTSSRSPLMCENNLPLWCSYLLLPKKAALFTSDDELTASLQCCYKVPIRYFQFSFQSQHFHPSRTNLQQQTVLLGDNKLSVLLILGSVWGDEAFNQPGPVPRLQHVLQFHHFSSRAFEMQNFTNGFRLSQDQYIPCTSWENNILLICWIR